MENYPSALYSIIQQKAPKENSNLQIQPPPMPSNRPVLPCFHAWHKNNRLYPKNSNMAPMHVPRTTLQLLQRCNNVPFVFRSVEKRTLALVLADGSSCKARKIRYYRVSTPFRPSICLFCRDCNVAFVLFFLKASVRFPSRRRRSLFCNHLEHIFFPTAYPKCL